MKKVLLPWFPGVMIFTVLSGCMGSPAAAGGVSLEEGIAQIARDIEAGLPEGRRIAAVNFESPSARFSDFVLEELRDILANNPKFAVIGRDELELLRNELDFRVSGKLNDEVAASIGHFLDAQIVVTGNLTDLGGAYRCTFNVIDVESAARRLFAEVTIRQDKTTAYMLPRERAIPAKIPSKKTPVLATLYFNSGLAYYEAGRYAEAIAEFTHALEIREDDTASLRYREDSYYYLRAQFCCGI
ncbi:MAG: tetratricopeptide repeat protein [Treponema sp.]|jgi:tetratricopeptide (TPR) repeat protein|nr:tetratricopeptide repeat protein [Treponema sp.]